MSTIVAHIEKRKSLAPKLRFKGFSDLWQNKKIGDVVNNKSQKYNPEKDKKSFKCIELEHLSSNTGLLLGYIDSINSASIKNKFDRGDVLFGKLRPYLRKYLQAPFEGVCSSEIWVLKGENISNDFLYKIIQTDYFIDLANQSTGSKMPRADWNVVSSGIIYFPTLPEQQKIASFISAIDEKIQQLIRKKELLEQYKKGVMQQLFSGKLRFKPDYAKASSGNDENGKAFPNWEKKLLGEIAERNSTKNRSNNLNFVLTNSATQGIVSQGEYFDREIANQNNLEGYYVVAVDDFVYNPRISVHAPVGPIKRNKLKEGVMSPLYSIFRFKEKNLEYFEHYFETKDWHTYLESVSNIGARHDRMNIANSDFFKMPIPFPCLEERNKITDFLNGLSLKIASANKSLTQTQTFKKGLLQQMFV